MDSIRRTVPRSSQKSPQHSAGKPIFTPGIANTSQVQPRPLTSNRSQTVAADLSGSPWTRSARPRASPPAAKSTSNGFKRTENNRDTHDLKLQRKHTLQRKDVATRADVCVEFCTAGQMAVRWVSYTGLEAIAVAGSYDGQQDYLSVYAVWMNSGGAIQRECRRTISHSGRVSALASGSDGLLLSASTNGALSAVSDVHQNELVHVGVARDDKLRPEGAVDVCKLDAAACVAGERGSLFLFSLDEPRNSPVHSWGEKTTDAGLRSIALVDASTPIVAAAGANGVGLWDLRAHWETTRLTLQDRCPLSAVTVDVSQPHFILAGTTDGQICSWDRRMVGDTDSDPISCVRVHQAAIWDMSVVAAGRPGRLLTCSEDGLVLLVDFSSAHTRSAANDWRSTGEFWRATVNDGDVWNLIGHQRLGMGVNSVDAHFSAELFAYASDDATVGFGKLSTV